MRVCRNCDTKSCDFDDWHGGWDVATFGGGTGTGSFKISSPFPEVWNNLYNSWNMAFVSGYVDNVLFYAKLLNPTVSGFYHSGEPAMYMWPRGVTLFMMVQQTQLQRMKLKRNMMTNVQWNRPVLVSLWGEVNLEAAYAYRARVQHGWDTSPNGWTHNPAYDAVKATMITATQGAISVMEKLWHELASKIAGGTTLSNEHIQDLCDIAQTLVGLSASGAQ